MNVKDAKAVARQWVQDNKARIPGYCGAIFAGSVNWYRDSMPWPNGSDVDICVYQVSPVEQIRMKKTNCGGVVLEPSYHNYKEINDPCHVLAMAYIAPQFAKGRAIDDPYGLLAPVYKVVREHYRGHKWTMARLSAVYRKVKWNYSVVAAAADGPTPFNVILRFMGGIHNTAVLAAVATYGNPTLRKCLVTSASVMGKCGAGRLHEELLGILGCRELSRQYLRRHVLACRPMFDRAVEVYKTPFWGDHELSMGIKKKMFAGTLEMIDGGFHREAVFYMLYIHHCCQACIRNDGAAADKARYWPLFADLSAQLGIPDMAACKARVAPALATLNRYYRKAKELVNT